MKNPFRRSTPQTFAYDPQNPPVSADGWDPKKMREDFEHHLVEDPINGVEAAWMCLCGKLVETIDKFNDALSGGHTMAGPMSGGGSDAPISPFTTFRKDG